MLSFEKSHMVKYDEGVLCLWTEPGKILSGGADGIIKVFSWFSLLIMIFISNANNINLKL